MEEEAHTADTETDQMNMAVNVGCGRERKKRRTGRREDSQRWPQHARSTSGPYKIRHQSR